MAYKPNKCWTCDRACNKPQEDGIQCPWAQSFNPVPGWTAKKTRGNTLESSYYISNCPIYKEDEKQYSFSLVKQINSILNRNGVKSIYSRKNNNECTLEISVQNRKGIYFTKVLLIRKQDVENPFSFKRAINKKIRNLFSLAGCEYKSQPICGIIITL